jgi:PAS domain S-box-containing protein
MVCLAVIAGTGVAGYLYTAAERSSFETEARNELAAVADMKVRQLTAWREERLADAKVLQLNPFTARAVRENLDNGRGRGEIETWIELLMKSYHYTAVSLWDRDCRRRLWWPAGETADDGQREFIMQAMRGQEPILGDLHRDVLTGAVHMTLAAPLLSTSSPEPFGALLLKIDPEQFLYPLIQSWPAPSRSAETLLVRREGNDVVFLNELRHRKDTALKLRLPITGTQLPAAKGALGYEGTLEGVDYRGVPVLAAARGVPGSAWFMVAKVDSEEVFAPLRRRVRFIAIFFGLAGLSLTAGIILLWSRQAAQVLRTSEVRYRRLFEAAKDGILILDVETGMIVDVNPFLIELLGFPREAFLNKRFWELGSFKDVAVNRANFSKLREKGYVRYEDIPLQAADGRQIEVEFVSNVYLEDNQNVIQCNVRDVTERKRDKEALRESEEKHRRMFETMVQGVVYQAADGQIISANPAAERVLGLSLDQMLGKTSLDPDWKSIREDGSELPGQEHPAMVALRTGKPVERFIMGVINPQEDAYRWISVTAIPLFQPGETTPFQVYTTFDDITARRRAEEQKARLEAQLQQAQKMESIGRLAGGVAHDFNNLLTVINGYSALALHQTQPGDPQFHRLTEILLAGERAADLVRQLLAFSRRQVLQPEVLDLNATVGDVEKMLRRLVGEDVEIAVKLDPAVAPVLADRHQIEQVIMNLAVNARDAMPDGGTLTLETGQRRLEGLCETCHEPIRPGTYVELTVRDSGMGMDAHTLEHLFEPFFTTKGVGHGTGLGLSTVQGIVIQSGGHVGVESEVGKGSSFHIYLPVAERPTEQPRALPVADAEGGAETILLVEDQEEVRKFIATILGEYGYKVVLAQDAAEALLVCADQPVDLLVTDVVMPKMSGVELARRLRLTLPGLRTLFISGYSEDTHKREWASLGDEKLLQKPFAPKALAAKVREVLEGR